MPGRRPPVRPPCHLRRRLHNAPREGAAAEVQPAVAVAGCRPPSAGQAHRPGPRTQAADRPAAVSRTRDRAGTRGPSASHRPQPAEARHTAADRRAAAERRNPGNRPPTRAAVAGPLAAGAGAPWAARPRAAAVNARSRWHRRRDLAPGAEQAAAVPRRRRGATGWSHPAAARTACRTTCRSWLHRCCRSRSGNRSSSLSFLQPGASTPALVRPFGRRPAPLPSSVEA